MEVVKGAGAVERKSGEKSARVVRENALKESGVALESEEEIVGAVERDLDVNR
jgi:hypothetical protein